MPLTVQSLGSGSSGNALLVADGHQTVAVDCGLGARALRAALTDRGLAPADLAALFLTHEHADHVRGLPALVKAGVRVVATAGTARAAGLPAGAWEEIRLGASLRLGPLAASSLAVSHDAAEPCGFLLEAGGARVGVLTDLGRADEGLREPLGACDLIVLEANHDEDMLRLGPYPPHLKRRVLSARGHLSNADCASLLAGALGGRTRMVWLAHLSQTNNRPDLARQTVTRGLARAGHAVPVLPLPRRGPGPLWRSDGRGEVAVQMPLF